MASAKKKLAPLHVVEAEAEKVKLDIGCGKTPAEGFVGIDAIDFGQPIIANLAYEKWKFNKNTTALKIEEREFKHNGIAEIYWTIPDNYVDEVRSSHFVEHLTGAERILFFNELWRVMKVGATAQIITPHWSHACAYGDPTHQWPPMSEWYPLYLNKAWRDTQAPHSDYTCDFDYVVAGSWDGRLNGRNPEYTQNAMNTQINGWRDLICTFTKKG